MHNRDFWVEVLLLLDYLKRLKQISFVLAITIYLLGGKIYPGPL